MTAGKTDDEHIIRMVLNGNVNLFRIIVERYQKRIFNIGMSFYRNIDDANDFVQEVFIKVYDSLDSFRGLSRFYHWMIRVAYNTAISSAKAVKQTGGLIDELAEDGGKSPESSHLSSEIKKSIELAMRDLPDDYRVCIELYFFHGMPFSEISDITGMPLNTIKSNVFRAKKILRNALRGSIAEDYREM
jgi:RNA polymerase sigma-70 factor, ECF subfamily